MHVPVPLFFHFVAVFLLHSMLNIITKNGLLRIKEMRSVKTTWTWGWSRVGVLWWTGMEGLSPLQSLAETQPDGRTIS